MRQAPPAWPGQSLLVFWSPQLHALGAWDRNIITVPRSDIRGGRGGVRQRVHGGILQTLRESWGSPRASLWGSSAATSWYVSDHHPAESCIQNPKLTPNPEGC